MLKYTLCVKGPLVKFVFIAG